MKIEDINGIRKEVGDMVKIVRFFYMNYLFIYVK